MKKTPWDRLRREWRKGDTVEVACARLGLTLEWGADWVSDLAHGLKSENLGRFPTHDEAMTAARAQVAARKNGSVRLHHWIDGLPAPWSSPCGADTAHEWHRHE
jgi:hypothetical protein